MTARDSIRKPFLKLEALPPDLRDLPRSCHPMLALQTGGAADAPPMVWPRKSALRLHPCRALPSAPVSNSVIQRRRTSKACNCR